MNKKLLGLTMILLVSSLSLFAQKSKSIQVPEKVKQACMAKYPDAKKVTWEKEKGNFEANWGGKSGEDHSVQFTPEGEFVEIVNAMPVNELPKTISSYVKSNYKGAKITEAGRVTDAKGNKTFEVEVNHKDLIFDENGNFVKSED